MGGHGRIRLTIRLAVAIQETFRASPRRADTLLTGVYGDMIQRARFTSSLGAPESGVVHLHASSVTGLFVRATTRSRIERVAAEAL